MAPQSFLLDAAFVTGTDDGHVRAVVMTAMAPVALVLQRQGDGWMPLFGLTPAGERRPLPCCFRPTADVVRRAEAAYAGETGSAR